MTTPSKTFRVAVVQAAPVAFDLGATVDKLATLASEAAGQGASLVVFPEAFVGAYPKGADFGARVGSRTPRGRDAFRRYFEAAIDVPGPVCDRIGKLAREHAIVLVVGVIERDGGTLYCSALTFGADGSYLGKHRKLMPTASERLIWGYGDGSTLSTFETEVGRVGAVICWENYMPLLRMAMYAQGVELYCAPTVDARSNWTATMQHIAVEGRCFVLSANQFARRSDYPDDYEFDGEDDPNSVLIAGGSCIVSPMGDVLAGPLREREGVLVAEVDLSEIVRGKYDFDVVGHYARPDVFRLHVDDREQKPVVWSSLAAPPGSGSKK